MPIFPFLLFSYCILRIFNIFWIWDFIGYTYHKYIFPMCRIYIYIYLLLSTLLWWTRVLNFNVVHSSVFLFLPTSFVSCLINHSLPFKDYIKTTTWYVFFTFRSIIHLELIDCVCVCVYIRWGRVHLILCFTCGYTLFATIFFEKTFPQCFTDIPLLKIKFFIFVGLFLSFYSVPFICLSVLPLILPAFNYSIFFFP